MMFGVRTTQRAAENEVVRLPDRLMNGDVKRAPRNQHRPHQGRWCFGKTPQQTFLDALSLAKEKLMAA
jgi:hypothetical protein